MVLKLITLSGFDCTISTVIFLPVALSLRVFTFFFYNWTFNNSFFSHLHFLFFSLCFSPLSLSHFFVIFSCCLKQLDNNEILCQRFLLSTKTAVYYFFASVVVCDVVCDFLIRFLWWLRQIYATKSWQIFLRLLVFIFCLFSRKCLISLFLFILTHRNN